MVTAGNASCEVEDFIETHLCKLRGILRLRVLRILCDLGIDHSNSSNSSNMTDYEMFIYT